MLKSFFKSIGQACLTLSVMFISMANHASADTIAFIGTGNVSAALGPLFAEMGHDIVYGSRSPERDDVVALVRETGANTYATSPAESVLDADMVVLAVPGQLIEEVVESLGDLSGKIIVDPTNPMAPDSEGVMMPQEISNAEIVQDMLPDSYVVKAFNTLSTMSMTNPERAGGPISIPIAGDYEEANAKVAALIEGIGIQAVDVGPVQYARVLEGLLAILYNSAFVKGDEYDFHFQRH